MTCRYFPIIHTPRLNNTCRTGCVLGLTHAKKRSRWTDVERVRRVISLPKKAFKSFCTWMLLPTVLYTPSCVTPRREEGRLKKKKKKGKKEKGSVIWTRTERWKCTTCVSQQPELGYRCSCLITDVS